MCIDIFIPNKHYGHSVEGYQYAFVGYLLNSKLKFLAGSRSKEATVIANHLTDFFIKYGVPDTINSDKAPELLDEGEVK